MNAVRRAVGWLMRHGSIVCLAFLFAVLSDSSSVAALNAGRWQSTSLAGASEDAATSLQEATRLQLEADRQIETRQFKEALENTQRALTLRLQHLGERNADVAYSMSRLGLIAFQQGQYERAEASFRNALRIREEVVGRNHPLVADSLNDLASTFLIRGDYVQPAPLYQRALAILRQVPKSRTPMPGGDVPALTADVLQNLGLLYARLGDYGRAETHYLESSEIHERRNGPNDLALARTLASLGGVYYTTQQYDRAAAVLQRALAIQESRLPPDSPSLATGSYNLAAVHLDHGNYEEAEALFRRALRIDEHVLDPSHPTIARRLVGLAEVLRLRAEYVAANAVYERARTIAERALGPNHPDVASTIIKHSLLFYATGDLDRASAMMTYGAELREDTLAFVLTTGSEEDKRLYLRTLADETDRAISLHLAAGPATPAAAHLALTNILLRKGRSIDAMADQMATVRRHLTGADSDLLGQMSRAQTRLATTVLRGVVTDEQRQSVATLRNEIQQLEQIVSSRSAEFRVVSRKASLSQIQQALPGRAALIEFVSYHPFFVHSPRVSAFGPRRYAAYVLRADGVIAGLDLGEAALIDQHVTRFRAALSNPADRGAREAGRALHQLLIGPLEPFLQDVGQLIISPDGALNLFPFAALIGNDDRYFVEDYPISYVTSGRDVLRLRDFDFSTGRLQVRPAIVADPLFRGTRGASARASGDSGTTRAVDSRLLDQILRFSPLPGTAQEAAALAKVLPDAHVYTGANASEAMVKRLSAPSILHIATHGFFLQPRSGGARPASRIASPTTTRDASPPLDREDALILSGLALAGANQRSSGEGEDGILTALEVAGLDLWGTRIVVLSACETGLGDARNGEGVYGLRRALVLAGSESQILSLWKVADTATQELMVAYYQRLRAGEGRADALRNVQLAMMRHSQNFGHPFYWAGFIESGDWRPAFQ